MKSDSPASKLMLHRPRPCYLAWKPSKFLSPHWTRRGRCPGEGIPTAILKLDQAHALGGGKHVHYCIEGLGDWEPPGARAHVFAVDDDVHVSCAIRAWAEENAQAATARGRRQYVQLIELVQEVAVEPRPTAAHQAVAGNAKLLNAQIRFHQEGWGSAGSRCLCLWVAVPGHAVVMARDGEDPGVAEVDQIRQRKLGHGGQTGGV